MTDDSYQGQQGNPLSQNLYAYVQNNPVNYTDPSGHFLKGLVQGAKNLYNKATTFVVNVAKSAFNLGKNVVNWVGNKVNDVKNWVTQQWNNFQQSPVYQSASHYVAQQQAQAQAEVGFDE